MSEYRLKIGVVAQTVSVWLKISHTRGSPFYQPFFVSEKKDNRSFISYENVGRSFFRLVTIHAFDRRTNGRTNRQTFFSWLTPPCIACSAVKT